jgi:hypothetical protein
LAIASNEERELNPSAGVAEIRALCVEFQRAIAALASNDIASVETSTAVQENLVDKLQDWYRGQSSSQQPASKISSSDFKALINLTRVYSSLLQRALRTTRLRASLCQTYRQNFPSAIEPAAATGWSCEV